jgi:hypothetical protein
MGHHDSETRSETDTSSSSNVSKLWCGYTRKPHWRRQAGIHRVRATSPSLCTAANNYRPKIPPNTAAFLTNGTTAPKTQGDGDRVAVQAVSSEPVSVSLLCMELTAKIRDLVFHRATRNRKVISISMRCLEIPYPSNREFLVPKREADHIILLRAGSTPRGNGYGGRTARFPIARQPRSPFRARPAC